MRRKRPYKSKKIFDSEHYYMCSFILKEKNKKKRLSTAGEPLFVFYVVKNYFAK